MKNTEKTFGGVIAEWMNTQLGIAYSSAAWVTSPVSPVMFSHHTVPLKSMKHCHCIWFQTDLSCVLSHFSLFPVSFYCQKYIWNYSEEWWTICSGFGKKKKKKCISLTFICPAHCASSLLLRHQCAVFIINAIALGALTALWFKTSTV